MSPDLILTIMIATGHGTAPRWVGPVVVLAAAAFVGLWAAPMIRQENEELADRRRQEAELDAEGLTAIRDLHQPGGRTW